MYFGSRDSARIAATIGCMNTTCGGRSEAEQVRAQRRHTCGQELKSIGCEMVVQMMVLLVQMMVQLCVRMMGM
jgi:hypothetical protein